MGAVSSKVLEIVVGSVGLSFGTETRANEGMGGGGERASEFLIEERSGRGGWNGGRG